MRPGRIASSSTASMTSPGVTQTGQPGPESSLTFSGSIARRPLLAMAIVCVPQTSISRISPSSRARIASRTR